MRRVTGEAVDAITADTRWPNPWLNDGPHGERNCASAVEDAVFADQKAGLMPEWAWSEARADDMPRQSAARQADAERVELRKRLSVLQSLGKCLG